MKKPTKIIATLMLCALTSAGVVYRKFENWEQLIERASDIFVARCLQTPERFKSHPDNVVEEMRDGLFNSDMEVVFPLKGATNAGTSKLLSRYRPSQGAYYLIFASARPSAFQAVEEYRVVPLGLDFASNSVPATNLTLQIRHLLALRMQEIDREMHAAAIERERLRNFDK
jgi:hypothetical protein